MGLLNCRPTRIKQSQYLEEKYGLHIKSIDALMNQILKILLLKLKIITISL